jgi:hypothetical protein
VGPLNSIGYEEISGSQTIALRSVPNRIIRNQWKNGALT